MDDTGLNLTEIYKQIDGLELAKLRWQIIKRELANTILLTYSGLSPDMVELHVEAMMSMLMMGLFTDNEFIMSGCLPGDFTFLYQLTEQLGKVPIRKDGDKYSIISKI